MIKDRLSNFFKFKKVSPSRVEKELFIGNGLLSKKISSLGSSILEKIAQKFPELNMDWVITGRGEMLFKPEEQKYQLNDHQAVYKTDKDLTIERLEKHLADKQKMIEMLEQQISKKTAGKVT